MPGLNWQKKWICISRDGGVTFYAQEVEALPVPDGWSVNLRDPSCRSKFLEFFPFDKVYDTREEAEAKI